MFNPLTYQLCRRMSDAPLNNQFGIWKSHNASIALETIWIFKLWIIQSKFHCIKMPAQDKRFTLSKLMWPTFRIKSKNYITNSFSFFFCAWISDWTVSLSCAKSLNINNFSIKVGEKSLFLKSSSCCQDVW